MKTMIRAGLCGGALLAVLAGANDARAEARTHDGFYMQLGVGPGYLKSSASGLTIKGADLGYDFLLGGSPIPGLAIGGGFVADYAFSPKPSGLDFALLFAVGGFVNYHLDPSGGLHFQAFVGWGGLETKAKGGNVGGSDPTGVYIGPGVGYDFFIGDEWSFGVLGRFGYGAFKINSVKFKTMAPALLATFTFH